MNKKELIEALEKEYEKGLVSNYVKGKNWGINVAHVMAKRLDEPEKVVIPQFVADWIRAKKENKDSLSVAMDSDWQIMSETTKKWLEIEFNDELFARAWLDGYTIEQEKRYRLESTNKHLCDYVMVYIESSDRLDIEKHKLATYFKNKYVFTESELAEIDETGFERVEVTQ